MRVVASVIGKLADGLGLTQINDELVVDAIPVVAYPTSLLRAVDAVNSA